MVRPLDAVVATLLLTDSRTIPLTTGLLTVIVVVAGALVPAALDAVRVTV
jgi:hypothetical protein